MIKVWDPATRQIVAVLDEDSRYISQVAWSPTDAKRLATIAVYEPVKIWDFATGTITKLLDGPGGHIHSMAWSPDGTKIAATHHSGIIKIWDSITGESLVVIQSVTCITPIVWSPHTNRLAIMGHFKMDIWDAVDGQHISSTEKGGAPREGLCWAPDGKQIATALGEKLWIWDTSSGECTCQFAIDASFHISIACGVLWSPSHTRLAATPNDSRVMIWDPVTPECIMTLDWLPETPEGDFRSKDGISLAVTFRRFSLIGVWCPGSQIIFLHGHPHPVRSIAWSPNSHRLVSVSSDGYATSTIKAWAGDGTGIHCISTIDMPAAVCDRVFWS
ncbi:YVTN repeat-like/Quino protein amine dehydrogenase [Aspergillus ellipticus CBS 707.79]|uniref:YVTN repeat-like/Quino protein amine dehydrogenase n=1 Tax=Aspergillus ellipticus CBS 707.79 TaxID=1448320 RepID=A0A319E4T1_9EURO|nr:YVTN repeat-like/Quino protein amine dehydrogenase [Aspergillus ellipticus CBS 707.79]